MATQSSRYANVAVVHIEPSRGWFSFRLHELWSHREILYFLSLRDIKVRYKQTVLGLLWAVIHPLVMMVVFSVVFGKFAKVPTGELPYPIFAYAALVPWTFFSSALNRCIVSLVSNRHIISKVYFPRLIVPLASMFLGLVEFAISLVILFGMMTWFGFAPTWRVLAIPLFLALALMTALSVGLWLTALNVKYRDVGHAFSFLAQIWMFASPVAYPVSLVPEKWQPFYVMNPMVGVIDGFRWALLGMESPDFSVLAGNAIGVLVLLVGGMVYFNQAERTMVDVI